MVLYVPEALGAAAKDFGPEAGSQFIFRNQTDNTWVMMVGQLSNSPPWQPRICSRTPMGYSDPHQCSLGAAACYLLYMLTRAILMPSLFHRLFQKQALARGHCRGRVGDDSLAFFGAEFETNRKVDLPRGNV